MGNILTQEIKEIFYKGKKEVFPVYNIPIEKLVYNKYNGRIKSLVKSFESSTRNLDPHLQEDRKQIEYFLYNSAEHRNEKTLLSLRDYGQQEVGIVTSDYVIIDGNRRASLIAKLARESAIEPFFKAIVLQDKLQDNPKEIIMLETNYQMGVDNKVEYKPIEKYLRCKELSEEYQQSYDEIAKLMSEKPGKIKQWLEILELMEEYLVYLGSKEVYTRLDKKEGHFVDLNGYIKRYNNSNINTDLINKLKLVYFDYIRLELPVARIRVIGNPLNSLFIHELYWENFSNKHKEIKDNFKEFSFHEYKKANDQKSNEEVFQDLDYNYKKVLSEGMLLNLVNGEIFLKEYKIKNNFISSLYQILSKVNEIDESQVNLMNSIEVTDILSKINTRVQNIINKI